MSHDHGGHMEMTTMSTMQNNCTKSTMDDHHNMGHGMMMVC